MFFVGCHLSVSSGYLHMVKSAASLGANTFQFFPRNPRSGASASVNEEDMAAAGEFMKAHGFGPVVCHGAYTMNAASAREEVRRFACQSMKEDLMKISSLPGVLYNVHPGAHVKQGVAKGITLIADCINEVLDCDRIQVLFLLETMAGKGTEIGRTFEELGEIIHRVERKDLMGVCLDTCHVYDAGYDIKEDLPGVLAQFDRVLGLSRLRAVHLNDDKNEIGSHRDRHEKIGKGSLGKDVFARIINDKALKDLPFILETPNELDGFKEEIAMLKSWRND